MMDFFKSRSLSKDSNGPILDSVGVAVRSGHHCCMPLHLQFGWQATVRASFQVYSTQEDIDQLVVGLAKVKKVFG